jgi:hypothetical protein
MQICRLCECKPAVFDAKLNDDMLTDCLRRVLDIYDSHSDASSELMDSIFALHFIHGSEGILRLISLHFHKGYLLLPMLILLISSSPAFIILVSTNLHSVLRHWRSFLPTVLEIMQNYSGSSRHFLHLWHAPLLSICQQ